MYRANDGETTVRSLDLPEMTVVLLGSAGYIGSAIRRINPFGGREVLTIDVHPVDHNGVPTDIVVEPGWDGESDLRGIGVPLGSTIISLAGSGDSFWSNQHPLEAIIVNSRLAIASVRLAAAVGTPRLVLLSSTEVYGFPGLSECDESSPCRPPSPYGVAKYAAECAGLSLAAQLDVPVAVARLGSAFGPEIRSRGIFVRIRESIRSREPMTVFGRPGHRQFTSLNDIAHALKAICTATNQIPQVLNVCSPEKTEIDALIHFAIEEMGMPVPTIGDGIPEPASIYVDSSLLRTTLAFECGESLLPWLRAFCLADED